MGPAIRAAGSLGDALRIDRARRSSSRRPPRARHRLARPLHRSPRSSSRSCSTRSRRRLRSDDRVQRRRRPSRRSRRWRISRSDGACRRCSSRRTGCSRSPSRSLRWSVRVVAGPTELTVTAAFIGCLSLIAILKFICHRPRFADKFDRETDRHAIKTAAGFDLRMPADRKEGEPPLTAVPTPRRPRKDRLLKPPRSQQAPFDKLPPPPPPVSQITGSPRPSRPRAPSSRETSPMLSASPTASPHVRDRLSGSS